MAVISENFSVFYEQEKRYLTIILRGRAEYEMINNQRGA